MLQRLPGSLIGALLVLVATSGRALAAITVAVSPNLAGSTIGQTIVLTATVTSDVGGAGVSWTKSGGTFANATTTSVVFSSAVAGTFTITARSNADSTRSAIATIGVTDLPGVFTQRYDAQRSGLNGREFALTPNTVTSATFGKRFACAVDGDVYAQPLYVARTAIGGGTHNAVLVATENDSVYAFDADANPCVQYWHTSFLGTGITTVPPSDTNSDITRKIGITGTPVIDPASNTLYVVAATKETVGTGCSTGSPCYVQRFHALDLATGNEKFGGPAILSNAITVPGSGDTGESTCPSSSGNVPFCPRRENQRPGLLLLSGRVYIAWAGHGDAPPYHGWVMGFTASDLTQAPLRFNATPNGGAAGIWMTGTGPAADANGNIYVISGNGTFDTGTPRTNYGDSFIELSAASLSVTDFFTPANQSNLNLQDWDLGSGGVLVLPDSAGSASHPHLLVAGDKQGILYLLDRDQMTGFHSGGDQILQEVAVTTHSACAACGIFSTPAHWQGWLYVLAIGDVLKQYTLANAMLSTAPAQQANDTFGYPGASPVITSSGATQGIVWVSNTNANGSTLGSSTSNGPTILYAYEATTLKKLYSSPTSGSGAAGNAVRFTVPTVVNGKVYVGAQSELSVFGLPEPASRWMLGCGIALLVGIAQFNALRAKVMAGRH
jgi:hypothetical protein